MWRVTLALLVAWALVSAVVCFALGDRLFGLLNLAAFCGGLAALLWAVGPRRGCQRID